MILISLLTLLVSSQQNAPSPVELNAAYQEGADHYQESISLSAGAGSSPPYSDYQCLAAWSLAGRGIIVEPASWSRVSETLTESHAERQWRHFLARLLSDEGAPPPDFNTRIIAEYSALRGDVQQGGHAVMFRRVGACERTSISAPPSDILMRNFLVQAGVLPAESALSDEARLPTLQTLIERIDACHSEDVFFDANCAASPPLDPPFSVQMDADAALYGACIELDGIPLSPSFDICTVDPSAAAQECANASNPWQGRRFFTQVMRCEIRQ